MTAELPANEHAVGPASDFPPGSHRVVRAGRFELGIFNVQGTYYALLNICPHQYGPVCTGPLSGQMTCNADTGWRHHWQRDGEIITCPWHGLEFDVVTGRSLAYPKLRVRQFPVRLVDDQVCVRIGGGGRRDAAG